MFLYSFQGWKTVEPPVGCHVIVKMILAALFASKVTKHTEPLKEIDSLLGAVQIWGSDEHCVRKK